MANGPSPVITGIGSQSNLSPTDIIEVSQGANTRKGTLSQLLSSPLYLGPSGTVGRSLNNIIGDVVNVKNPPFNAVGDGVTDDTAAINAAIAAVTEGGTVYFPTGRYSFSTLSISKAVTLQGAGWLNLVQASFGDASWSTASNTLGSILVSTATSGTAITFNNVTNIKPYHLRDLLILGPGTGTSTGVNLGTAGSGSVECHWSNVLIANFSSGCVMNNVEDSAFLSLRFRGCTTGLTLGSTSTVNQNTFNNLEIQSTVTAFLIQSASLNLFSAGLIQGYTTGLSLTPNVAGGLLGLTFDSVWWESGTTAINIDTTTGPVQTVEFRNTHLSATAGTFSTAGANSISRLALLRNDWTSTAVTIPSTSTAAIAMNNHLASFTDNGTGTFFVDTTVGIAGAWSPSVGGNATYTGTPVGRFIKIGRMVFVNGSVTINVLGTGSVNTLTGLPFTSVNASPPSTLAVSFWGSLAVTPVYLAGVVNANVTTIQFYGATAATATLTTPMNIFGNGARVDFSGWYEAAL